VKITGGAVASLTRAFFILWKTFKDEKCVVDGYFPDLPTMEKGGFVQPYDDCPLDRERVGEGVYLDLIERAEKRLYITTPYLLLGDLLRSALIRAAKRGVDVRIVTPAIPDKKTVFALTRANYEALLLGGVRIYEYTPGFMHAKSVLCDDCAVVGTINFDFRSLYHHFENAVYFSSTGAVQTLEEDFEEVFAVSKEQAVGKKRSVFSRLFVSALRLIEPLM
jgi:cardiolipin synthase